jgi:hypothetical protein
MEVFFYGGFAGRMISGETSLVEAGYLYFILNGSWLNNRLCFKLY